MPSVLYPLCCTVLIHCCAVCRYVDEVVIGSPTILRDDLIKTFNISLVVRGSAENFAQSCYMLLLSATTMCIYFIVYEGKETMDNLIIADYCCFRVQVLKTRCTEWPTQ